MDYQEFIESKSQGVMNHGFEPVFMPDFLFDFQKALVEWAVRKGKAAIFADCGLGKTPISLVWAQNVIQKTNKPVLILTPLAVTHQFVREGKKFGIDCKRSPDGKIGAQIVVSNYERLHYFSRDDFSGVVCDESGILKNFSGVTRAAITEFMRKTPYRLLCTATPSPNDFIELGTSSEAIGELGFIDMIGMFFKKSEKTFTRSHEYRHGLYRFRGHAERNFWKWVCSWARAIRKPSDMNCDDNGFILPALELVEHIVKARTKREGWLFEIPAVGLQEQREERRRTISERCEMVASLVSDTSRQSVCWCHLNTEGDTLKSQIKDSVQVSGKDDDDRKERIFEDFVTGNIRVLVTKSSIAGFGVNWQHCNHQTFFPSHSFEAWYQSIRRSWRFGQKKPVTIDIVTTEGERDVLSNLQRKQDSAERMIDNLVKMMAQELGVKTKPYGTVKEEVPAWL